MPKALQRIEVEVEDVQRRRLHDHLELVVMLQPVGVLAVAAVGRAAGRLHVGDVPRLGAEDAQEGGGIEGAGPLLGIIGLLDHAPLLGPVALQGENQILKCHETSIRGKLRRRKSSAKSILYTTKGRILAREDRAVKRSRTLPFPHDLLQKRQAAQGV